jgi:hypothetical protein
MRNGSDDLVGRKRKVTTRKSREFKTGPQHKERKSKVNNEYAFPSRQERLPVHHPGAHQVAMGTREEVVAWLQRIPGNSHVILISFSNEATYKKHGPICWHVAKELPKIVARVRRRRFEQLVDALTQLQMVLPGALSRASSGEP